MLQSLYPFGKLTLIRDQKPADGHKQLVHLFICLDFVKRIDYWFNLRNNRIKRLNFTLHIFYRFYLSCFNRCFINILSKYFLFDNLLVLRQLRLICVLLKWSLARCIIFVHFWGLFILFLWSSWHRRNVQALKWIRLFDRGTCTLKKLFGSTKAWPILRFFLNKVILFLFWLTLMLT